MTYHDATPQGVNKLERYGWKLQDAPGELMHIPKNMIMFNESYQRGRNKAKILSIARDWSWMAMGVITVARRNGGFYAVDGMHRVSAALLRSDVVNLPCIVFDTIEVVEEAKGFVQANTLRKPVGTADKHRALVLAKDENALFVQRLLDRSPFEPSNSSGKANAVKCFGILANLAKSKPEALERAWPLVCDVCDGHFLNERILQGLVFICDRADQDVTKGKWRKRILDIGFDGLRSAAESAAAYYSKGGARVWADGMMTAINKGMRHRLELSNDRA